MAFNGWLVKVGDYTIPNEAILLEGYAPLRSVQDMDSGRDGSGILKRNILDHEIHKVEINLRSMTNHEFDVIMNNIRANYIEEEKHRTSNVTFFLIETGDYVGPIKVYTPDIEGKVIKIIDSTTLKYSPITLKFIAY